jgi:hypothetical protein
MEDIEKELGPLLDEYNNMQQKIKGKKRQEREQYIAREKEFKDLFNTIVKPVMADYSKYLETKNIDSYITEDPNIAEIAFGFHPSDLTERRRSAEINFSRQDEKLRVVERNEMATVESNYEKQDLTHEFIRRKITDLIKNFFEIDSAK